MATRPRVATASSALGLRFMARLSTRPLLFALSSGLSMTEPAACTGRRRTIEGGCPGIGSRCGTFRCRSSRVTTAGSRPGGHRVQIGVRTCPVHAATHAMERSTRHRSENAITSRG